ncbi:ROK family protein, partial [Klebsiella pneumoniae]|nr:ROK family protein [Klebsiella pneumoniae]
FDLAKEGDVLAKRVVDRVSYYLGLALANVGNTMNPSSIIIGGGVSAAGDFLLDQVISYFNQFTFPTIRDTTALKLAVLGNDAGVIGAGSLAP